MPQTRSEDELRLCYPALSALPEAELSGLLTQAQIIEVPAGTQLLGRVRHVAHFQSYCPAA
jgi:hypothetical protein